jgi:zinc D-Ala-D-Ala carboxypeptidase
MIDWSKYPNFTPDELACKHCKENGIRSELLDVLQSIRADFAKPIFISSGYRCAKHPIEQEKGIPGEHTTGLAVDIICHGVNALRIINLALNKGVTRIGIHQKGNANGRFVHLGISNKFNSSFPAAIWTY